MPNYFKDLANQYKTQESFTDSFTMTWTMERNPKTGEWENHYHDEEYDREQKEIKEKRKHYKIKTSKKRKIFVLGE